VAWRAVALTPRTPPTIESKVFLVEERSRAARAGSRAEAGTTATPLRLLSPQPQQVPKRETMTNGRESGAGRWKTDPANSSTSAIFLNIHSSSPCFLMRWYVSDIIAISRLISSTCRNEQGGWRAAATVGVCVGVCAAGGAACATNEKTHSTIGPAYMPEVERFPSSPNSPNIAQKGRKKAPAVEKTSTSSSLARVGMMPRSDAQKANCTRPASTSHVEMSPHRSSRMTLSTPTRGHTASQLMVRRKRRMTTIERSICAR